jgi:hypothetical protein
MSKRIWILVGIFGFLGTMIVIGLASSGPTAIEEVTNDKEPETKMITKTDVFGLTGFVVLKDGTLYKARFTLVDKDNYALYRDGHVLFQIYEKSSIFNKDFELETKQTLLYERSFEVKASDFAEYKLALTGQPIYAYAWQFKVSDVKEPKESDISMGVAVIEFTTPDGETFKAEETVFL